MSQIVLDLYKELTRISAQSIANLNKMSKLVLFLCIAFLAVSIVVAQEGVAGCKPPGFICSSDADCCAPFACNPWAGRCTKPIAPPVGGAATQP